MALILAFAIAVLMNAIATVLLKVGSAKIDFALSFDTIKALVTNYYIIGGLLLYTASFPPYAYLFNRLNVSIAYPIFTSLAFATTVIIAGLFLKESISILQLFGLILVVGGIILLATNAG